MPVTIDLNRFRTCKTKAETIKDLEGRLDIVIEPINWSIKCSFKDLGLLIVDEEQKFGVNKEIKRLLPLTSIR
jgi:transcription-repair coupling factor (superfamily II helicase)